MHQALYRKWRPSNFDEVCGQEHVSSVLKYQNASGKLSHAYLFCGSRGTGKTSCAKILAKAVNCLSPVDGNPCGKCEACLAIDAGTATDVLEMDAASNNGVENIRDIRDEVIYTPAALKYRVYIVDEVHMLSPAAFNALLKTLEEPPAHVIFILATTELQKLPATIISRCQRFDFRRIATPAISGRLLQIAAAEGIALDEDAATLIAKLSQGGMRDAISLLELCSGKSERITAETVTDAVGGTGRDAVVRCVTAVAKKDHDAIFDVIDGISSSSKDLSVFWQDVINFYRDMLIYKSTDSADKYLDLTETETEQLAATAALFSLESIIYHCKLLDEAFFAMQRQSSLKRSLCELTLIRMCDEKLDTSYEALLSRISALEDKLAYGIPRSAQKAPEKPEIRPEPAEKAKEKEAPKSAPEPEKAQITPLPYWREAADEIVKRDGSLVGFISPAKAYKDASGAIHVRFANAFAMKIMSSERGKSIIRAALSPFEGREIKEAELALETAPAKGNERSSIDEIMDNIE